VVGQLRRYRIASRVKIPVQTDVLGEEGTALSDGVVLEPGHLHISFLGTEDLLSKLYALSQTPPKTSTGSGPRQNRSNRGVREAASTLGLLSVRAGAVTEQDGIKQR
jgi:hypothetical protein